MGWQSCRIWRPVSGRRNPEWGVRDLERVIETAAAEGLALVETNEMPANEKLIVSGRRA
jgi:hypothetical protein